MNFVDSDDDLYESQRKELMIKKQKKLEKQARLEAKKKYIEEIRAQQIPRDPRFRGDDKACGDDKYKKGSLEWAQQILNVKPQADFAEIKQSYLQRAQKIHPDKNQGVDCLQEMQNLNEAWNLLKTQFR